jgi:type I restriction enzyme S subunit
MAGEDRRVSIEELIASGAIVAHKDGNYGSSYPRVEEFGTEGVPFLTAKSLREGYVDIAGAPRLGDARADQLTFGFVQTDDVLLSHNATIGRVAVVPQHRGRLLVGTSLTYFRVNPEKLLPRYLAVFFAGEDFQNQLVAVMSHSTRNQVPVTAQRKLHVIVPPLAEQKAIAAVLGALDDKIELNRRMNATLEAMARTLFQSWFVDFDPVRAKLDGRQPVGLDPDTAALFPVSFDGSAVGQIPNGWSIKPVGEVVDCVGGGTPSTAEPIYWEGGTHHWTTPKDFSSLQAPVLLDTDRKLTDAGIAKISSGLLPAGTLLLSSRAPVGYLAITAMPVAINQGFIALKCNGFASNIFMLNWCQTNIAEIKSRATGTTFAEISKQNFRPIPVVLPPIELMAAFTAKAAPLYAQITANLHQSQALANMRDTLLPKLLSGELALPQMATSD